MEKVILIFRHLLVVILHHKVFEILKNYSYKTNRKVNRDTRP